VCERECVCDNVTNSLLLCPLMAPLTHSLTRSLWVSAGAARRARGSCVSSARRRYSRVRVWCAGE
jgi:hypothetical protein